MFGGAGISNEDNSVKLEMKKKEKKTSIS